MKKQLSKYIKDNYGFEHHIASKYPDIFIEEFEGNIAESQIDKKGFGRITKFLPHKVYLIKRRFYFIQKDMNLDYNILLKSYPFLSHGNRKKSWKKKETKFTIENVELGNRKFEIKSYSRTSVYSIDDQYYILPAELFLRKYGPNYEFENLHPYNKERLFEIHFKEKIAIEENDNKFLSQLANAPESKISGFDKHLTGLHPRHIADFYNIERHVKILPNYRIYLGRDILFNSGCPCPSCVGSNYIKRTRIFFRIQKGKVSKLSERVASVRFKHFNFSFNYMLSKCLLKHPDILKDISEIALQTNDSIQQNQTHRSIDVTNNSFSKNPSIIIENSFDFEDSIMTYFIKDKRTKIFYAIDQFGKLWFNRHKEINIWLQGIKLQEKGWIKLKVDTIFENERYMPAKYLDGKISEFIPEKEVISNTQLIEFSILDEFTKKGNEALILNLLQNYYVKIDDKKKS